MMLVKAEPWTSSCSSFSNSNNSDNTVFRASSGLINHYANLTCWSTLRIVQRCKVLLPCHFGPHKKCPDTKTLPATTVRINCDRINKYLQEGRLDFAE